MTTSNPAERLDSWKEIAAFLRRDVRTVQRWEKKEGLPVYRHQHEKLGSVYAFPKELTEWLNTRQPPAAGQQKAGDKIKPAELPVIARTTAEHYEASPKSLRQMRQDLGVDYVLEGNVRRAGNRVRIT